MKNKKSNKKLDTNNIIATICAIIMFFMMIVLLVYFIAMERSTVATIILCSIFGLSAIGFIVFGILFFLGTPNIRNKR